MHLHGVDSEAHSQASAPAHSAHMQDQPQALVQGVAIEAQSAVSSAQQDARQQAFEYSNKLRDEAERQVLLISPEPSRQLPSSEPVTSGWRSNVKS